MTPNQLDKTLRLLESAVECMLPRLLSQGCRDPLSPEHGCFDRNWWHYKIRDFPSVILQQAGYTAWEARSLTAFSTHEKALGELAAASCRFWQDRALRSGAFEEYYPWEQGYPPLAFSTLTTMKLVAAGLVPKEELRAGARIAARQLIDRFEPRAANQQVAGLAALAWLRRVYPALVPEGDFERQVERTLALQCGEGWYMEYDGPDLGYLSVTLDCLWDLHDATGDDRFLASARRALDFLHTMVATFGSGPGMHNARNTDYILPYGMLRFAVDGAPDEARKALDVFELLYGTLNSPTHFVHAIDDRYLCHYVGHSLVRALGLAEALVERSKKLAKTRRPAPEPDRFLPESGYALARRGEARFLVSTKKGGIVSGVCDRSRFTDFGWTVRTDEETVVTHWWAPHWKASGIEPGGEPGVYRVEGALVPYKFQGSSTVKHAALRGASRLLGPKLITPLKNVLIFQSSLSSIRFERTIHLSNDGVDITDRFENLPASATLIRSPRSSKRHVASADSYHTEDCSRMEAVVRSEREHREGEIRVIETTYRFTCPELS